MNAKLKHHYFSVGFFYRGVFDGTCSNPKASADLEAATVVVESAFLTLKRKHPGKIRYGHQYSWTDGSLYYYARIASDDVDPAGELSALLAGELGDKMSFAVTDETAPDVMDPRLASPREQLELPRRFVTDHLMLARSETQASFMSEDVKRKCEACDARKESFPRRCDKHEAELTEAQNRRATWRETPVDFEASLRLFLATRKAGREASRKKVEGIIQRLRSTTQGANST